MIYETMRYVVRSETVEGCKAAVHELVEHVQDNEPSTLFYLVLQDGRNENHFLHVAAFADREAKQRHQNSEAMRMYRDLVYPVTVDGMDIAAQTLVDRIPARSVTAEL